MEIANVQHGVLMRDSKTPEGPALSFAAAGWQNFIVSLKNGEFDAN